MFGWESSTGVEVPAPALPLTGRRLVLAATGLDEAGTPSIALWWAGMFGEPKAGWVFHADTVHRDRSVARRLFVAASQGMLVDRRPGVASAVLERLAVGAGSRWPETRRVVLDLDRVVADLERQLGADRLGAVARPLPRASRCPVVDRILGMTDLLGWCVRAWRAGLAASPQQPLPPYWMRQVQRWAGGREPRDPPPPDRSGTTGDLAEPGATSGPSKHRWGSSW
jgi:hypothetical protein